MNSVEKAQITKELSKASAALSRAFSMASEFGDRDMAIFIKRQQIQVANAITGLNGGPVQVSGRELLCN